MRRQGEGAARACGIAAVVAALWASAPAQAQYAVASEGVTGATALREIGAQFAVGGGAQGFVSGPASELSSPGGQWEFALAIHPPLGGVRIVAFEVAYVGAVQRVEANGAGALWTHGAEALMRLQPALMAPSGFEPYGFAGVGVAWFAAPSAFGASKTLDAELARAVTTLPMGMGVQWRLGGVLFDLRSALRARLFSASGPVVAGAIPSLDAWSITLRVGADL